MTSNEDQIKELELEVERLQEEGERYRRATEDSLQQLGWCIGYFAATRKPGMARALAANADHIRRGVLHRQEVVMPTQEQ